MKTPKKRHNILELAANCRNQKQLERTKPPSPETIAVSKAIKQSIKQAESIAVVESAIRWCSNIIIEVHSCHSPNLTKSQNEELKKLSLAIQDLRFSLLK